MKIKRLFHARSVVVHREYKHFISNNSLQHISIYPIKNLNVHILKIILKNKMLHWNSLKKKYYYEKKARIAQSWRPLFSPVMKWPSRFGGQRLSTVARFGIFSIGKLYTLGPRSRWTRVVAATKQTRNRLGRHFAGRTNRTRNERI